MAPLPGSYSFLPWLRLGLANRIDAAGVASGASRAEIPVTLRLEGAGLDGSTLSQTVTRSVPLYGPGDILGIDRRAIIRTEPRDRITNFEPNYMPFVEFYDEDFPWRYTPEVPAGHQLRPWVALVVLRESEFEEVAASADRPLSGIRVVGAESVFPPFEQLGSWAHVHANRDLGESATEIVSDDMSAVLPRLRAVLGEDPDLAYSRLLCPRRLDESTTYHAFLIPSYESGRLAGLGHDPAGTPALEHGAWVPAPGKLDPDLFPYYHRWSFITGTVGDFEYLVRLLEPRPIDIRVGRRDIDVQRPGSNLRGIGDPSLGGVLRLGGALRVPLRALDTDQRAEFDLYEDWDDPDYPRPFQRDLAAFIDLADDYAAKPADEAHADSGYDATVPDPSDPGSTQADPDPLITPPLYGRWHSLTQRLLNERDGSAIAVNRNWVHELNLDPRHRTTANFGTEVVQQNQERYMDAAWEQIGDVIKANEHIRFGQLAKLVSRSWYLGTVLPMKASAALQERALALTAPVQGRVLSGGPTLRQRVAESYLPPALLSTQARRALRPGGRLVRATSFDATRTSQNLMARVANGQVRADPPRRPLDGAPTLNDVAEIVEPERATPPEWAAALLRTVPWMPIALFAIAAVLVVVAIALWPAGVVLLALAAGAVGLAWRMRSWKRAMRPTPGLRAEGMTPSAVDELPSSPNFHLITDPSDPFRPSTNGTDSAEATRFKVALREAYGLVTASRAVGAEVRPAYAALDLAATVDTLVAAIDPSVTIPRHIYSGLVIPARIRDQLVDGFVEAQAYPEIDIPMYRPLVDISEDNFLPNLRYIGQNTISLLETNQAFIEAYMVGLNHEFARELLWREYPTDQRGSSFRQFWDPSGYLDDAGDDAETLRERLRDIPPLHTWADASHLRDHDHRHPGGGAAEEVVLVIRGELLKRYPNAVIYAHRASWQRNTDGTIDHTKPRELDDEGIADATNPPRDRVKSPLYEAKVEPDITFLGFDLTVDQAVGDDPESDDPDPGWFFVIKERPGEPRFGFDIGENEHIRVWNDLGWDNVAPGIQPGDFLEITSATTAIPLEALPSSADDQTVAQAADDQAVQWNGNMDAAELAYITYQVPVLVAVHAAEMMPRT
jgi:hypothetical protein